MLLIQRQLMFLLLLFISSIALAEPVILYSDIESGPKNGWSSTEPQKGASVTIWGYGFGSERGQSYVSVNGVSLLSDNDYSNWGEQWPTPFYQRITFWLNDQMSDGLGEIRVNVNNQVSNSIPFTIRSGRIFFIQSENQGGIGNIDDPFDFSEAKSQSGWLTQMQPGDIYYFNGSAPYTEKVGGGNFHIWFRSSETSGTPDAPIAFLAYPTHKPLFLVDKPWSYDFQNAFYMENDYLVISGLSVDSPGNAIDVLGNYHRVVGNDFLATSVSSSVGKGIINVGGDGHIVLGNNVHGMTSGTRFDHGIYVTGCSPNDGVKLGWNYLNDNDFGRGPEIAINHQNNRCPSDVYLKSHFIFNNIIYCNVQRGTAINVYDLSYDLGETEPEPTYFYNNLIVGCGTYDESDSEHIGWAPTLVHTNGHARFYNNTLYNSGFNGFSSRGDLKLSSYFQNNIVYMTPDYPSPSSNYYVNVSDNNYLSHNLYYGIGTYSECTTCLNDSDNISLQDPLFVDPANFNFALQEGSPAIGMGTGELLFEVAPPSYAPISRDIHHLYRHAGYEIGAFEFNNGTQKYTINGNLSGLNPGQFVTIQNNSGDDLQLNSNGRFSFATPLSNSSPFQVTVLSQSEELDCIVENSSGHVVAENVTDVLVSCHKLGTPSLLFSDIQSAPKTGWSASEPNKGAAVTIWGYGFGNTRGESYVSVNGVHLTADSDYANWGEYWPTPMYQKITFWLNNEVPDGPVNISVTVKGKTSNNLPFTTRDGRIFFIEAHNVNGNGTDDSPFDFSEGKIGKQWITNMLAGDIFYFKDSAIYSEFANGGNAHIWFRENDSFGTPDKPIAFLAYPNHKPTFDVPTPYTINFQKAFDIYNDYSVISGFTVKSPGWAASVYGNYHRVIGNDFANHQTDYSVSRGIINVIGDGHMVLGNNIHGMQTGKQTDHAIMVNGCATQDGVKLGWNYIHSNDIGKGAEILFTQNANLCQASGPSQSNFVFSNTIQCNVQRGSAIRIYDLNFDLGEVEPDPTYVFNNLIVGCGTYHDATNNISNVAVLSHENGHAEFYNNTLYSSGYVALKVSANAETLTSQFRNNIVHMDSDFTASSANSYILAGANSHLSHNLYYGLGNYNPCTTCAEDTGNISNQDPLFIDPLNFVFELQPSSPAIDRGLNNLGLPLFGISSGYITHAANHALRIGIYDIGAMELDDGLPAYRVGGRLSGLADGAQLTLQLEGIDELDLTANGDFSFANPIVTGTGYQVSVKSQPRTPRQICRIDNATGTILTMNVENLQINCIDVDQDTDSDGIPDIWDNTPNTADPNICTGEHVYLEGTYSAGTQSSCRATSSITIGSNLVVESGAGLALIAPQVIFEPGFFILGNFSVVTTPIEP